jgi:hypothetical protein
MYAAMCPAGMAAVVSSGYLDVGLVGPRVKPQTLARAPDASSLSESTPRPPASRARA